MFLSIIRVISSTPTATPAAAAPSATTTPETSPILLTSTFIFFKTKEVIATTAAPRATIAGPTTSITAAILRNCGILLIASSLNALASGLVITIKAAIPAAAIEPPAKAKAPTTCATSITLFKSRSNELITLSARKTIAEPRATTPTETARIVPAIFAISAPPPSIFDESNPPPPPPPLSDPTGAGVFGAANSGGTVGL